MSADNKLQDIIKTSLESIRTVVDADTVIGKPIETPNGTTVIPVSRVSVGFASGGLDYNGKHHENGKAPNFGGGGGTGMSVVPVGFLVCDATGGVSFISTEGSNCKDPICQVAELIDKAPSAIEKIKDTLGKFVKKKKKNTDDEVEVTDLETPDETTQDDSVND